MIYDIYLITTCVNSVLYNFRSVDLNAQGLPRVRAHTRLPKSIWQCLETFKTVTTGGDAAIHRAIPRAKKYLVQNSNSTKVRKTCFKYHHIVRIMKIYLKMPTLIGLVNEP